MTRCASHWLLCLTFRRLSQLVRRCKAHILDAGKIWDQPRPLLISSLHTCAGCSLHFMQLSHVLP